MYRQFKKRLELSLDDQSSNGDVPASLIEIHDYNQHRGEILKGNVNVKCPSSANIVRIFTSSTFTDTKHERNRLMETVYPNLKQFCHELGYEFQVVDMRWGIRDEVAEEQDTTDLCLREVDNCRRLSVGPTFVTFLSHKYGHRPFPTNINVDEFECLLKYVKEKGDNQLLKLVKQADPSLMFNLPFNSPQLKEVVRNLVGMTSHFMKFFGRPNS